MSEDLSKSVFQEVKKELEVLEEQFRAGRKELEESYRQKNELLSALVKKVHRYVSALEKQGSENLGILQRNSKYLLEALDSDFDISYTEFEDTSHDLKQALHQFEESLDAFYKELDYEAKKNKKDFESEVKNAIAQFKKELTQHRILHRQLTQQSVLELEDWKIKSLKNIDDLKQAIHHRISEMKKNTGKFREEMGEAYETLKSAFDEMRA